MVKVELGVYFPDRRRARRARRIAAAAALIALALSASGCSMIDQFNPFGAEKYKMEVMPDTPASKTYDQGLEKLANGAPQEAAKKFTELGKQYPELRLGAQRPADDRLRQLSGRRATPTPRRRPRNT